MTEYKISILGSQLQRVDLKQEAKVLEDIKIDMALFLSANPEASEIVENFFEILADYPLEEKHAYFSRDAVGAYLAGKIPPRHFLSIAVAGHPDNPFGVVEIIFEPDGSWKSYKWVRDREPCL